MGGIDGCRYIAAPGDWGVGGWLLGEEQLKYPERARLGRIALSALDKF